MKFALLLSIDRNAICHRLGYKVSLPPKSILSVIDLQLTKAYKLIKPVYIFKLKAIEGIRENQVFIADSLVFISDIVSYVLSDCRWAAIFLVTIGGSLGEELARLEKEEEMLEAVILDAIGSEAIEQTCSRLESAVREKARASGYQATARYSPGYCDWDVSQQRVLFRALDSASIGVSLTESSFMIPLKSVSGIIGIGKFGTKPSPCLTVCKKASCSYRRG